MLATAFVVLVLGIATVVPIFLVLQTLSRRI
jgi:hypothetical protein